MKLPTQIRELIKKGDTAAALDLLLKYAESKDLNFQDTCQLLSGQYYALKQKEHRGVKTSPEDFNEINNRILEILSTPSHVKDAQLGDKKMNAQEETRPFLRSRNALLTALSVIVLALVITVVYISTRPQFEITSPNHEGVLIKELNEENSYKILIEGTGPKNKRIYGEYRHGQGVFTDLNGTLDNPEIIVGPNGKWEAYFFHGERDDKPAEEEEFVFKIYQYQKESSKKKDPALDEIKFKVLLR